MRTFLTIPSVLLAILPLAGAFAADPADGLTYDCALDSAHSNRNLGALEFTAKKFSMGGSVRAAEKESAFDFTVTSEDIGGFDPSAQDDVLMTDYDVTRSTKPDGNVRISSMLAFVPRAINPFGDRASNPATVTITLFFPGECGSYRRLQTGQVVCDRPVVNRHATYGCRLR